MRNWFTHCYARLLIDNHITEDDPSFMAKFDPAQYVAMVKKAGVEAAMVYAVCHNGNSYYPTKVGHMHANLKGRDIFGETVNLLRKEGIVPLAYYTSIFHNHSAKTHPAWRMTDPNGAQHRGRYWWNCPNSDGYVSFVLAQIGEILSYDIEGLFNDMVLWPAVCVCSNCRTKYLAETGLEIPARIDWSSREWIAFQRFRERSLASFARKIADFSRAGKDITVAHNTATLMHGWPYGYSRDITATADYATGDLDCYTGKYRHIVGAKMFSALSKQLPYEFMTTRSVGLNDHTSMKSEAAMTAEAAVTLANAGAYFFIDAINPDGTLEPEVYERLGSVSKTLAPFAAALKHHQPRLVADQALYFSPASFIDASVNADISTNIPFAYSPPVEEISGTCALLTRAHIPFVVLTDESDPPPGIRTIVMNNIRFTSKEENDRLRAFVKAGGTLIATGSTSLCAPDGSGSGDFGLADVFGVTFAGMSAKRQHYLSFEDRRRLVACAGCATQVKAKEAKVLAGLAEPLFNPDDTVRYASIHSNPPGILTDFAGLTLNYYGKGKCLFLASPVLSIEQSAQQKFGEWLFREHSPSALVVDTNAPECVEITLLRSTTKNACLVGFVNYQRELPNVSVRDLRATIRLPDGATPKTCLRVSDGSQVDVIIEKGAFCVDVPCLETIEMIEVIC